MVERTEYPRPQSHILNDTRRQKRQPSNDPFIFFLILLTSLLSKCFLNNLLGFFFLSSELHFLVWQQLGVFFSVASLPSLPWFFLLSNCTVWNYVLRKMDGSLFLNALLKTGVFFFLLPPPPSLQFLSCRFVVLSWSSSTPVNSCELRHKQRYKMTGLSL